MIARGFFPPGRPKCFWVARPRGHHNPWGAPVLLFPPNPFEHTRAGVFFSPNSSLRGHTHPGEPKFPIPRFRGPPRPLLVPWFGGPQPVGTIVSAPCTPQFIPNRWPGFKRELNGLLPEGLPAFNPPRRMEPWPAVPVGGLQSPGGKPPAFGELIAATESFSGRPKPWDTLTMLAGRLHSYRRRNTAYLMMGARHATTSDLGQKVLLHFLLTRHPVEFGEAPGGSR